MKVAAVILRNTIGILALALALAITGMNYSKHQTVIDEIEAQQEEAEMQTVTHTWTSGGKAIEVKTPRNEGEPAPEWVARHKEAVDAMDAAFPQDPPAGG